MGDEADADWGAGLVEWGIEDTRALYGQSAAETSRSHMTKSRAKATRGKTGTAGVNGPVRRSTTGSGLLVGVASADLPATSEHMDVTAGETAPSSVEILSRRKTQVGPVAVTFTFGRIK